MTTMPESLNSGADTGAKLRESAAKAIAAMDAAVTERTQAALHQAAAEAASAECCTQCSALWTILAEANQLPSGEALTLSHDGYVFTLAAGDTTFTMAKAQDIGSAFPDAAVKP